MTGEGRLGGPAFLTEMTNMKYDETAHASKGIAWRQAVRLLRVRGAQMQKVMLNRLNRYFARRLYRMSAEICRTSAARASPGCAAMCGGAC